MDVYPRIIPVLLLEGDRLVKTRAFSDPVYVGDPVNVLSIFNDFEVDEIALIDISAARRRCGPDLDLLAKLASECFIPLSYGGGVDRVDLARRIVSVGVEKVIVNSALMENPDDVRHIVTALGSQSVVGAVDVRRREGHSCLVTRGGTRRQGMTVARWAELARDVGVGEVLVTSVDREGSREGFDLDLISELTQLLDVPVIAHGGAGTRGDLAAAVNAGASAAAAGSQFVFHDGRNSVLVNYPTRSEVRALFPEFAQAGSDISADRRIGPRHVRPAGHWEGDRKTCRRCLITEDVPNSGLESSDVCYYCGLHDALDAQYPTGAAGRLELRKLADKLHRLGRGKKYDCVLGVSGGCDSSYLAHLLVQLGVRPLAVHFDNTWNSPTATANIHTVLGKLKIDLETYVVDNTEYDDLYRAFMLAGVRDVEAPTDIGFMGVLYRAAEKHDIKVIVEGHSFRTEGVSPLGWLYMDGGYIADVHARYGTVPLRTFPNMELWRFVKWAAVGGIERVRPLYHLDYRKEDTKEFLSDTYGWKWYGGHHLENRFTAFYHTYLLPNRFGIDFRQIEFSALIRSGQLDRDEGAARLAEVRIPDPESLALVKKRLRFTDQEFDQVMTQPQRTYREFRTYKLRFERLRPLFWLLYKTDRVPKSFYVKFCQ